MRPANLLLSLPELQKLHRAGYSPIILRDIEDNLVMQATEIRMMAESKFDTREELLEVASQLLPKGDHLLQLYKETERGRVNNSAEDLAMLSEHIERAAYDLEYVGAKTLAARTSKTISSEKFDLARAAIGRRYADLIDAAEQVVANGGPASVFHLNLVRVDERPEGPLSAFFDAAVADLASRAADQNFQRQRAHG